VPYCALLHTLNPILHSKHDTSDRTRTLHGKLAHHRAMGCRSAKMPRFTQPSFVGRVATRPVQTSTLLERIDGEQALKASGAGTRSRRHLPNFRAAACTWRNAKVSLHR
jgi:hypothetical protein